MGEKNSAARIDVMFVGLTFWRAADGAVPSRVRPIPATAIKRANGWGMCATVRAGYAGRSRRHNDGNRLGCPTAGRLHNLANGQARNPYDDPDVIVLDRYGDLRKVDV